MEENFISKKHGPSFINVPKKRTLRNENQIISMYIIAERNYGKYKINPRFTITVKILKKQ